MNTQNNTATKTPEEKYLLHLFSKYTRNQSQVQNNSGSTANQTWSIMIYTLGRFKVICNGEPLIFPGRAKRKPLEMLKALIAFGGRDVNQEKLSEALWPDSEGDAAHRSFDTTLHRLRKLIGNDNAIQLQEGRLSLNSDLCWVDAWAFERLQGRAESILDNKFTSNMKDHEVGFICEQILSLYQDHFLNHTTDDSWCLSFRERLRSKYIRLLRKAGRHWQKCDELERAVDCYQRGLELDHLIEGFYQGLIACYRDMDLRAEAIVMYNKCKSNLNKYLNINPSKTTTELYNSLIR